MDRESNLPFPGLLSSIKTVVPKVLKYPTYGLFPSHILNGTWPFMPLDGQRFLIWFAVATASAQNTGKIPDPAISIRVLFDSFLSEIILHFLTGVFGAIV